VQAKPSDSVYNTSTPKMWPSATMAPNMGSASNQTRFATSLLLSASIAQAEAGQQQQRASSISYIYGRSEQQQQLQQEQFLLPPDSLDGIPRYDSEVRSYPGTQTFGSPSQPSSRKRQVLQQTGRLPTPPRISSRPCSRGEVMAGVGPTIIATATGAPYTYAATSSALRTAPSTAGTVGTVGTGGTNPEGLLVDGENANTSAAAAAAYGPNRGGTVGGSGINGGSLATLSALQSTLVHCGKLNLVEQSTVRPIKQQVERGIAAQKLHVLAHAQWLKQGHEDRVHAGDDQNSLFSELTVPGEELFSEEYRSIRRAAAHNSHAEKSVYSPRDSVRKAKSLSQLGEGDVGDEFDSLASSLESSSLVQREQWEQRGASGVHGRGSGSGGGGHHHSSPVKSGGLGSTSLSRQTQSQSHAKSSQSSKRRPKHKVPDAPMEVPNIHNSENPFRQAVRSKETIVYARSLPRQPNQIDPLDYKDEMSIRTMGNFNACIKPGVGIGSIPSQSEVNSTMVALTRKAMLSYSTRVVECGGALKALKDPRHLTPGLQAVLALHKGFVAAAAANPNNWLLNRKQLSMVFAQHVPWFPDEAKHRLLLSFDAENTGLIRYVRITTTLLCCSEPAMTELASSLNRARDKTANTKEDNAAIGEFTGELIVISLIHGFYEECGGGTMLSVTNKNRQKILSKLAENTSSHMSQVEAQAASSSVLADGAVDGNSVLTNDTGLQHAATAGGESGGGGGAKKVASFGVAATSDLVTKESGRVGVGMRMQDFIEAFSCCAGSIEDELLIAKEAGIVLQFLFDRYQKNDILAGDYLKNKAIADQEAEQQRLDDFHRMINESVYSNTYAGSSGSNDADGDSLSDYFQDRGKTLKYAFKNGVRSICAVEVDNPSVTSMLNKKPLRNKDNSMDDLINDPLGWKKKLKVRILGGTSSVPTTSRASASALHSQGNNVFAPRSSYGRGGGEGGASTSGGGGGGGGLGGGESSVFLPGGDSVAWTAAPTPTPVPAVSRGAGTGTEKGAHGVPPSTQNSGVRFQSSTAGAGEKGGRGGTLDLEAPATGTGRSTGNSDASSSLSVLSILKHSSIATAKDMPRISQEDLIYAMKKNPRFLKEFVRQMKNMRLAAQPYVFYGSKSIEESISQFNRSSRSRHGTKPSV
jgi:hypothetical protein